MIIFSIGGKSDPFFEIRKAHGMVSDRTGAELFKYEPPGDKYMGTLEEKSRIIRSDIVKNDLNPKWMEVEVPLGRKVPELFLYAFSF